MEFLFKNKSNTRIRKPWEIDTLRKADLYQINPMGHEIGDSVMSSAW
jgi:hypothetical protein